MASRRSARRRAIDVLFEADLTDRLPSAVLADRISLGERVPTFSVQVIQGVEEHLGEIDRILGDHAEGWTVPRMATVDRAVLRLGVYELLYRDDVPAPVAINEAVEAVKRLSTEDSGRFVNGILGRIARERAKTG